MLIYQRQDVSKSIRSAVHPPQHSERQTLGVLGRVAPCSGGLGAGEWWRPPRVRATGIWGSRVAEGCVLGGGGATGSSGRVVGTSP